MFTIICFRWSGSCFSKLCLTPRKEFSQNFDDIIQLDPQFNIKSGSIAQVYKVKFKNNTNNTTNTNVHGLMRLS